MCVFKCQMFSAWSVAVYWRQSSNRCTSGNDSFEN